MKLGSNMKNQNGVGTKTAASATVQFKENNVYLFRYNEAELKARFSPYHCFDGQLVVKVNSKGEKYFVDTYWASKYDGFVSSQGVESKTIDEALSQGELTFVCNLNDVEEIKECERKYYDDEDIFDLSYQHHCYSYFVKRKGAVRSQAKMLQSIKTKIEEAEYKKQSAERDIVKFNEILKKIEAGDTSVNF
jgi:hypothetical protein